jgi:hypothetical protein
MTKQIDRKKAPEGATHFNSKTCKFVRIVDGNVFLLGTNGRAWINFGPVRRMFSASDLIPLDGAQEKAETVWAGDGLPPVGTYIEWFSAQYGWLGGRVVGHDGMVTVVSHNDGYTGCHAHAVRPIRTPEQIAAEEREKEVNRMVATAQMLDKGWARKVCESLYDAGYRKTEGGAE